MGKMASPEIIYILTKDVDPPCLMGHSPSHSRYTGLGLSPHSQTRKPSLGQRGAVRCLGSHSLLAMGAEVGFHSRPPDAWTILPVIPSGARSLQPLGASPRRAGWLQTVWLGRSHLLCLLAVICKATLSVLFRVVCGQKKPGNCKEWRHLDPQGQFQSPSPHLVYL